MSKLSVSLYIIEEHHEAFLVWLRAIKNGKISEENNTLLHFDDHSDMTTLRVNKPMDQIFNWSDEELIDFTYNNLTISSFIIAASFLKIIKNIVWCKVDMNGGSSYDIYITSYNNDNKNIISGRNNDQAKPLLRFEHQIANYSKISLDGFIYRNTKSDVLLDIDLDFFSCIVQPENNTEIIIEISKTEYEDYNSNKYHPINFISNRVEAIKKENNYYFIINYYKDVFPSPRKVSKIIIENRINLFVKKIKDNNISPSLITVCRSRYSGYTPIDQWEFIEKKLLSKLYEIFNLKILRAY